MKTIRYALLFGTALAVLTIRTEKEPFQVVLSAKWENLDNDPQKIALFGGKWILAGSITFKKRSSEMIFLDEIQLTWEGEKLDALVGSLYEKNDLSSLFLPIERYLVCDGCWRKSTQQLFLRFNRTLTLGAVNTFYLVLTVPKEIEEKLKNGKFRMEKVGLPLPYRQYVGCHELAISLNELHNPSALT